MTDIPYISKKWLLSKFWTGDTYNTGLACCYLTKRASTNLLNFSKFLK